MLTSKFAFLPVERHGRATVAFAALLTLSLAAVPATAQTADADAAEAPIHRSVTTSAEDFTVTLDARLTAEHLLDMDVVTSDGDEVGEVVDLLLADDGAADRVIVEAGGFLGMGESHVAIELERMTLDAEEEDELIVDLGRTDIEGLPSYEEVERGWRRVGDSQPQG